MRSSTHHRRQSIVLTTRVKLWSGILHLCVQQQICHVIIKGGGFTDDQTTNKPGSLILSFFSFDHGLLCIYERGRDKETKCVCSALILSTPHRCI